MASEDRDAREARKFLDNLTEFLAGGDREVEEIADSIRAQGGDPEQSLRHFHALLAEHAPTWREKAARERALLIRAIESRAARPARSRDDIQREIRKIIESMRRLGAPVEAGAYYRKFKEAQDEDLESLLEDVRFQRDLLKAKGKADSNG